MVIRDDDERGGADGSGEDFDNGDQCTSVPVALVLFSHGKKCQLGECRRRASSSRGRVSETRCSHRKAVGIAVAQNALIALQLRALKVSACAMAVEACEAK